MNDAMPMPALQSRLVTRTSVPCDPSVPNATVRRSAGRTRIRRSSPAAYIGVVNEERNGVGAFIYRLQRRSVTPCAAITVCIIIDNRVACEALARMLGRLPDVRPVAASGIDATRLTEANAQVLLLGAELQDSVQVAVALKSADPDAKVIVMDLNPLDEDIREYVKAGVAGFILKNASFDEFVGTIRQVADGQTVLPPPLTDSLFSRMTRETDGSHAMHMADEVCMTPREREVIDLICAGLHNREIAQRLGIGSDTVKSHVRNILAKLSLHSRVQIAAYAGRQQTP